MFRTVDLYEFAFIGESSQPKFCSSEHHNVSLDELIRMNEDLLAVADSEYQDFLVSTLASIDLISIH